MEVQVLSQTRISDVLKITYSSEHNEKSHNIIYIGMFVINFLAPIQVRLSPNFVSHTLATGDKVIKFWKVKGQGRWGRYVCSAERSSSYSFWFLVTFV